MAEFDMWGPGQDGFAMGQQNAQKAQLNELAIQQESMKTQKMQQDQKAQQQQQQQMQDVLLRNKSNSALELSQDMIREGMIEQGSKLMGAAAQAENHLASADKARSDTAEKQILNRQKVIQAFSSTVDNIHSQDDYNRAIQEFEPKLGVKLPDSIKNATWSPEYKDSLQKLGTTWKERSQMELETAKFASQERDRASKEKLQSAQLMKTEAQTREINTKNDRLQKDSGSNAKTVRLPKEDVTQVMGMLSKDFPDEESSSEKANAAYFITSRAQTLLQQNKGMDRAAAIQKSYNDAKRSGELSTVTSSRFLGLMEDKKLKFTPEEEKKSSAPQVGTVQQGYRFKGGDPSKSTSWEKQ